MSDSDDLNVKYQVLSKQAFDEADPIPPLLKVIKEYSAYEDIEHPMIECYVEALEENPYRGQVLASALASWDTLRDDIRGKLSRQVHFKVVFEDEECGPRNKFLFHSLLFGLSLKHQLTQNSTMYAAIAQGLNPDPGNLAFNVQNAEVLVV